jgi:DinB superfamily
VATPEQVQDLIDKMAAQRAELVKQAAVVSEEDATRVPVNKTGEEQWTVKEQLAHLCEMELSYDAWVRAALAEDNPNVGGVRGERAAIPIEDANEHQVAELLEVMASEREETMTLIGSMSLDDFDRTATHPMFGTLTAMQWLRSFYRHDRMHADQISGREPEYRPRFTGAEPDQRTPRLKTKSAGA